MDWWAPKTGPDAPRQTPPATPTTTELRLEVREQADEAASYIDPDDHQGHAAVKRLQAAADTLADRLDAATGRLDAVSRLHHGPRTGRHGSGCVQCGIAWPCPTALAVQTPIPVRVVAPLPQCSTRPGSTPEENHHV